MIAHEDIADAIFILLFLPGFIAAAGLLLFFFNNDALADVHFAMTVGSTLLAIGLGSMLLSQVSHEKREGRINVGSKSRHYVYREKSPMYFKIAVVFKIGGGLFSMALGLVGLAIYVAECHKQGRFPSQPAPTHVRAAALGLGTQLKSPPPDCR